MRLAEELRAIRAAVAIADSAHVAVVRVSGSGAFDAVARTSTADLYLQDAQMRPSLVLREDATVLADLVVGRSDEAYFLLAEGVPAVELATILRDRALPGAAIAIEDMTATHAVLSLHGPYAWELLGEHLGPDLVSLPYLSLFHVEHAGSRVTCFRGGKTGEYGFDLLVDRRVAASLREALEERGKRFDAAPCTLEALDHAGLENGFFNVRREGTARLDPLELQLQWRTGAGDFVGAQALSARRAGGTRRRVTHVVAPAPLAKGDVVTFEGAAIGAVLDAVRATSRDEWIGLALLDLAYAHAGIDRYRAREGSLPLRTVTPPRCNNRSLYVSPQRHAFATRGRDVFPPIDP